MKGLKSTAQKVTLPKVPALPAGSMKGTKGKGINTAQGQQGTDLTDYARILAAGGR